MTLPRVKIIFENGLIGSTSPMDDGVSGVLAHASAVEGKFELNKAYLITAFDALQDLGITESNNATLYKFVKEFYSEAPAGTKLWIFATSETVSVSNLVDVTGNFAPALLEAAKGEIRILSVATKAKADPTIVDGMDSDVYAAIPKAQALGDHAADTMYAPIMVLLEALHYAGDPADLANLHEMECNRVGILVGDTSKSSNQTCIGLLAGRIASIPVQRSIARVRSGAIAADTIYFGAKEAANSEADVINGLGYITMRSFVGKVGYYFSDDSLAVKADDDYALIPRRRVIDKACRIAYQQFVEELSEEIPTTIDGEFPAMIVKSIQNSVERAIVNTMAPDKNLGTDPSDQNDTGVQVYIDPAQNVVQTSRLVTKLRVKPYGYLKYIDVMLGFQTTNV